MRTQIKYFIFRMHLFVAYANSVNQMTFATTRSTVDNEWGVIRYFWMFSNRESRHTCQFVAFALNKILK